LVIFGVFYFSLITLWLTPLQLTELDAKLNALKAMVDNAVAFSTLVNPPLNWAPPQMLDSLPTRSQEIILANMRQSVSLTLWILKSLYPQDDLDAAGEGFMVTNSDEEALKLVEDSSVMVGQIIDMLGVDRSLG
jgi:hypothetical protein